MIISTTCNADMQCLPQGLNYPLVIRESTWIVLWYFVRCGSYHLLMGAGLGNGALVIGVRRRKVFLENDGYFRVCCINRSHHGLYSDGLY